MISLYVLGTTIGGCILGGIIDIYFLGGSPSYWIGGLWVLIWLIIFQAIVSFVGRYWK